MFSNLDLGTLGLRENSISLTQRDPLQIDQMAFETKWISMF